MPPSECAKAKKKKLSDYLNSLEEAAKNAARALYKKLGELLCALANAVLAQLQPIFALEKVVVENFIIFPLNAVAATFRGVTSLIAAPINAIADNKCKQHGDAIKSLQKYANDGKTLANQFQGMADSASKKLREMDEEIQSWQTACGVLGTDLQTV